LNILDFLKSYSAKPSVTKGTLTNINNDNENCN
jgi:hypothetical protein